MSREARTGRPGPHRTSSRGAGVVRVEAEGAHGRAGSREEGDTCLNPWNISPKKEQGSGSFQNTSKVTDQGRGLGKR